MESKAVANRLDDSRSIERNNLILVLLGALFSCLTKQLGVTLSFIAGGVLTLLNFRLWRLIVGAMTGQKTVTKGRLIGQVLVKFFGMIAILAAMVLYFKPEPIPFLLGLSTIVVAIGIEGLVGLFRSDES